MIERLQGAQNAYPEHDCKDPMKEVWHNQDNACYTSCGICKKITGFHYKSFWKRFKALFNFQGANPIK